MPRPGDADRADAERWLDALTRGDWSDAGRLAKVEGDNFTRLGELHCGSRRCAVVLKQLVAPPGAAGSLRSLLPNRRSMRQWRGAEQLRRLGFTTSRPILLASGRTSGRRCDWLLLERIEGRDLLHHLADDDLSVAQQHRAARRIGELVRELDERGWFNRDSKLSNLIRTPDGGVAIIDTVGVQRRPGKRVRMLSAMLAEAMGAGLTPRRGVLMRCVQAATDDPRDAWRRLERFAAERRDHTPRADVLAMRQKEPHSG